MRKIKFRGRRADGYVNFGDLIHQGGKYFIEHRELDLEVEPESIAQLVGIDSNSKEVYEGDEVVDKFGEKYLAQLTPTLRENHEGAGGVFSKPTERFWTERRQYTPLTLVEQCT